MTALVLGTTTGLAAPGTSSAFGISADGAIPIDPTPYIESTDGSDQTDSLVDVPLGENGSIKAATVAAGDDTASVELAGVELSADQGALSIKALTVACEGDTGTVSIVDADLNGTPIVIPPPDSNPVNQEIAIPGAATITYNQQLDNADGTFTVNALVVDLLDGQQNITIGSATCGGPSDGGDDGGADDGGADDGGDDGDDGDGPDATEPAPITTGLPVTG